MDYGGCDRRTTKNDLRKKRSVYKRGGQHRTSNISSLEEKKGKNKNER